MNRKDEHVSLAKAFHDKQKTEFDFVRIIHNPLPQIAVSDVDLSTQAAGFTLSSPFYINAMTGGSEKQKISQDLCNRRKRSRFDDCHWFSQRCLERPFFS